MSRKYIESSEPYTERWEAAQTEVGEWYRAALASGALKGRKGKGKTSGIDQATDTRRVVGEDDPPSAGGVSTLKNPEPRLRPDGQWEV